MIRMFDRKGSGTISFEEFTALWRYLGAWRELFDRFDIDGSGRISLSEFERAMISFGYRLSQTFVSVLFATYQSKGQEANGYGRRGSGGRRDMSFDLFVQACDQEESSMVHLALGTRNVPHITLVVVVGPRDEGVEFTILPRVPLVRHVFEILSHLGATCKALLPRKVLPQFRVRKLIMRDRHVVASTSVHASFVSIYIYPNLTPIDCTAPHLDNGSSTRHLRNSRKSQLASP